MRETKLSLMLGLTFIALIGVICWALPVQSQEWEITAYCPCEKCCSKWADGITASGHKIQKGDRFVAAPIWIPFNTLLTVEGYAGGLLVPVLDRGGAIKNFKLDVYFDNHQTALNWGRRKCKVRFERWAKK